MDFKIDFYTKVRPGGFDFLTTKAEPVAEWGMLFIHVKYTL